MAIDFSGSAQRLVFSGSNITIANQLSFSLWFNKDDGTVISRLFMINKSGQGFQVAQNFEVSNRVNIGASTTTETNWGDQVDGKLRATTSSDIWHHVCGTVSVSDGSNDKTLESAFLDGIAMTDGIGISFFNGNDTGTIYVAARSDAASHFNGTLAECAIWDSIQLTAEEAAALAAGAPTTSIRGESLVFYAPLPEIDGVDLITGSAATKTGSPVTHEHPPMTSGINMFVPTVVAMAAYKQRLTLLGAG